MKLNNQWLLAAIGCFFLTACGGENASEAENEVKPATVEAVAGTNLHRVILTAEAAKRLDIQMAPVAIAVIKGVQHNVVPYSAIIYDPDGKAWVYKKIGPLTFIRTPIVIDTIENNLVSLTDGPPLGTEVVKVGVSELYGTEFEGNIQE